MKNVNGFDKKGTDSNIIYLYVSISDMDTHSLIKGLYYCFTVNLYICTYQKMSETSDRFLFRNKGYHYKYEGNKGSENHQT